MYKSFTSLKKHYGTETMLEVVYDELQRKELLNRPLYKDGRQVEMFYSTELGLYAKDFGECGIIVKKKVDEEYLETLMMHAVDYYAITGDIPTEEVVIDVEAIMAEAEECRETQSLTTIKGCAALFVIATIYIGVEVYKAGGPSTPTAFDYGASTRSKSRKR